MEAHKTAKRPDIQTSSLKEMYDRGLSTEQIAKHLGICKTSVGRRLKNAGIALRKSSDYSGNKRYWLWKGDNYRTDMDRKRGALLHRKWSRQVLERDNYQCQDCLAKDVKFHAHHLVSLTECLNSELEYDVSNGITLCVPCHWERHKAIRKKNRKSTL